MLVAMLPEKVKVLVVGVVSVANTTSPLASTVKNLMVPVEAADVESSLSRRRPDAPAEAE